MMPGISPTVSMWINLLTTVAGGLVTGATTFSPVLGAGPTGQIAFWGGLIAAGLGAINSYLHANSSAKAGPSVGG